MRHCTRNTPYVLHSPSVGALAVSLEAAVGWLPLVWHETSFSQTEALLNNLICSPSAPSVYVGRLMLVWNEHEEQCACAQATPASIHFMFYGSLALVRTRELRERVADSLVTA